jgi:hypothetical protein
VVYVILCFLYMHSIQTGLYIFFVGSRIYKIYTDGPGAVYLFGGDLYKIYGSYTKRVP